MDFSGMTPNIPKPKYIQMKTLYITALSVAVTLSASAQFQLQEMWHGAHVGDLQGFRSYDSVGVVPKTTGANQTWDLSAFSFANAAMMITYKAPSAVPASSAFPTANLAADEGTAGVTYYNRDTLAGKTEIVGESSTSGNTTFANAKQVMKWPLDYGGSFSDTYSVSDAFGSGTGSVSCSASGYGTVKLPGGISYQNCMQIKCSDMLSAVSSGTDASTFSVSSTIYTYYWDQTKFPLLQVMYNTLIDTSGSFTSASIEVNYLFALTGITEHNFGANMTLCPNPASDHFNVQFENNMRQSCVIEITDAAGRVAKRVDLGSEAGINATVPVDDLNKGLYFVKTSLGNRQAVQKLLVE